MVMFYVSTLFIGYKVNEILRHYRLIEMFSSISMNSERKYGFLTNFVGSKQNDMTEKATNPDFRAGLTYEEVERSRAAHGANILTPPKGVPVWRQFLEKFKDPLIIILLIAGIASIGISCYEYYALDSGAGVFFEPCGIFMAVFLATGLGFYFEYKANKEFALLNEVSDEEPVQVIREGNVTEVPRKDVVVGDIVIINTGAEIPADGQLLEATSLNIDESTLTGEPVCHKTTDPAHFDKDATFPSDCVLRGTKVMEGHGVMRVTAVGDNTENGRVYTAAQIGNDVKTPLNIQLEGLGSLIAKITYIIGALVIAGRMIMFFVNHPDFDFVSLAAWTLQSIMVAVALVVVSIPEGLPMAVTLSLAYSMRRMLKTNNLVRKMHACETMGATTVICTDKTGTLTQNRMQVSDISSFNDTDMQALCKGIAVNTTAELDLSDNTRPKVVGNPTEGALLLWLRNRDADYAALRTSLRRIDEIAFSSERKYMATLVEDTDGHRTLFVKGAPEIVAGMCAVVPDRKKLEECLLRYQNQAMRTLGFASAEIKPGEDPIADGNIRCDRLVFEHVVAISDPVRPDVPDAVKECTDAGIQIKVVTGDTPATAVEIGRRIGLLGEDEATDTSVITGPDFAALSDMELDNRVDKIKIIARARPLDKKRLVETLQRHGEVVAVTGDGTNDAPALKAAQVGLSMGDGTAVAKEASDITIIDNSFASIGRSVMWGRSLYRNIRRFILFQMTVNVVACLIVLCGAFMGTESPLSVTQMLWVNLIMDTFAAMALASLPPSPDVMKDKPRSRFDFIINRSMWNFIIGTGLTLFIALFGLLYYFEHTNLESLTDIGRVPFLTENKGLSRYELSLFFTIFVFVQFWNLFNVRAFQSGLSAFHFKGCRGFLFIVAVILFGQIAIVSVGGNFFNVEPLKLTDWIIIIAGTSVVLWIGEAVRMLRHITK